jgi:tRNA-2-methylthio-N6-dimethylallyladenosine synthase
MNAHDSEKMAGLLGAQGMAPAESEPDADLIILNTCAVREKASEKVFSRLGALRKHKLGRPELIIGVCGCVAQMEQEIIFRRAPYVDFVMGPRNLSSLAEIVQGTRNKRHQLAVIDPRDRLLPEESVVALRSSSARAFITIMEGCNKGCTFCIVPSTRGRESCRSPESILKEASEVVGQGIGEIELLGQNVNAYRSGSFDFTRLLSSVAQVPGLRRLRFTTSHPLHFKNSIPGLMAMQPVLCPHVHLPIQSGSNQVLKNMRRGYTREEYFSRIERARLKVPGIAFSSDIIVGFPGETEEDFQKTLDVLEKIRFDFVYAFLYSPRRGTPAIELQDAVSREEKTERLYRVQELQAGISREINSGYVGSTQTVLVEGPSVKNPAVLCGRTPTSKLVNFQGPVEWTGKLIDVEIVGSGATSLKGNAAKPPSNGHSLDFAESTGYN